MTASRHNDNDRATLEERFLEHLLKSRKRLIVESTTGLENRGCPSAGELAETVAFSPQDGSIWLCGQRMVLLQTSTLGTLRRELVENLGTLKAREVFTRTGWQAGAADASQVSEQWPQGDPSALFSAGPRLHMLEGMLNVEALRFEMDNSLGHFDAEFLWHNSVEADVHIAQYGIGNDSACWMAIGYASGYASSLLGRLVVFREVECRACGQSVCRIVGKPAEQWDDVQRDLAHLDARDFISRAPHAFASEMEVARLDDVPAPDEPDARRMVGISSAFVAASHLLRCVAPTQATVLLTGESGVGKELFAENLHRASSRQHMPLISLNCATLPENLVEAELFGVERGAFTGAERTRAGRFERADGGTLFLDEIGTLSLAAQSKILRALQEGEIERVGGNAPIRVDVRVVAATNLDLRAEVAAGRFREDLFYRLNVFPIHLPPLRERREDIPLLMNHFLRRFSERHGRRLAGFTTRLLNALLTHAFPGNIRELQNLIERGVIACPDGAAMDISHLTLGGDRSIAAPVGLTPSGRLGSLPLPGELHATALADAQLLQAAFESEQNRGASGEPVLASLQAFIAGRQDALGTSLDAIESLLVKLALERSQGNITAAAQMLGMSRAQVSYRLKR
ncbi:sigma-54-dependent Fis family transcriptional regulator [Pseudomonas sp. ZM23]|uniref:Sigma-54-dependent Fis family transcriptional regulator n=1 Tax=Pseudomonas triclosanedens TaxID=2961893 RepID=A0ABY7A6I7_9PSED|nr:sigma-54-dependent Fis family transcriptional regulator [Pseudomonas triclosanedens]MCP8467112.1 sigma-54-dependent Fis family transcriptional regulator [Pseudomonas triclosanedens]MCP8472739.1 sigma-54-dependent Fis family transcriptional regulator [Pseudomonas triclosanedens]MCP8478170.1 sigma-54-dependent Fis family transcriptional regulator [Pseudomonas triclosanedens]WAI52505.1 sigma-54-dependent Fis family transcriptional regulator [Pseudomonas triclosanedens]